MISHYLKARKRLYWLVLAFVTTLLSGSSYAFLIGNLTVQGTITLHNNEVQHFPLSPPVSTTPPSIAVTVHPPAFPEMPGEAPPEIPSVGPGLSVHPPVVIPPTTTPPALFADLNRR